MSTTGRDPTPRESFFLEWGQETLKMSIYRADEMLARIVSLSIALAGGGLVTLDKSPIPETFVPWIVFLLLLAASSAIVGVTPRRYTFDANNPAEIETHKQIVLKWKSRWLSLSSVLLVFSLCLGLVGVTYSMLSSG